MSTRQLLRVFYHKKKYMNAFNIWLCQDDDKLEVINHRVVFLPHWNGQPFKGGPFVPYHGTSNIKKIANICFKKGIFATVHVPNATYLHQFAWKTGYSHASHVYESSTSSTHRPVQKDSPKKSSNFASCSWKQCSPCNLKLVMILACKSGIMEQTEIHEN